MIIDFHTHCFPDRLAPGATETLRRRSGIVSPFHDGTAEGLARLAAKGGVDCSVVLNIATNPKQQKNVNDFAISQKDIGGLIPFGSVHPDSPDALDEMERLASNGIKGIKLHPDYQGFCVDDERMFPIYKKAASLGMITVFHCGVDMGFPFPVHCDARRLSAVLDVFEGAPVVAAHMGGCFDWNNVIEYLCGRNVYLDTAFCVGTLPPAAAKRIIDAHGTEKRLFATDSPWNDPGQGIELVRCFGLSKAEEKAVLGENARKLLGI